MDQNTACLPCQSPPALSRVVCDELGCRVERLPGYSYKLMPSAGKFDGPQQYGMDAVYSTDPGVDESDMSFILHFADGSRRDGVGDLLNVEGIDTSRHRANPIILFDHAKSVSLPIGYSETRDTREYTVFIDPVARTAKAKVFVYDGKKGIDGAERGLVYDHALFCEQIFDMWAKRLIRAGSIGYQVVEAEELPQDWRKGIPKGLLLNKVLMLEASAVVLPANGDTVRKALSLPKVCGKPLSPYLVKALQPYAARRPAQLGWEPGRTETKSLDRQGGEIPTDTSRAQKVDLITLPEGVQGTNCSNCRWVTQDDNGKHRCTQPLVKMAVTDRMCCALWDSEGVLRSWEQHGGEMRRPEPQEASNLVPGEVAPAKSLKALRQRYHGKKLIKSWQGFRTQALTLARRMGLPQDKLHAALEQYHDGDIRIEELIGQFPALADLARQEGVKALTKGLSWQPNSQIGQGDLEATGRAGTIYEVVKDSDSGLYMLFVSGKPRLTSSSAAGCQRKAEELESRGGKAMRRKSFDEGSFTSRIEGLSLPDLERLRDRAANDGSTDGRRKAALIEQLIESRTHGVKGLREKKCPLCGHAWGPSAIDWAVEEGDCLYCEGDLGFEDTFEKALTPDERQRLQEARAVLSKPASYAAIAGMSREEARQVVLELERKLGTGTMFGFRTSRKSAQGDMAYGKEGRVKGKKEISPLTETDIPAAKWKPGKGAVKAQPSDDISPEKARQILKDGEANGHPLTEKQRGMFGAAAGKDKSIKDLRAHYGGKQGSKAMSASVESTGGALRGPVKRTKASKLEDFMAGRDAFIAGEPLSANPYPRNSDEWKNWGNGWASAKQDPEGASNQVLRRQGVKSLKDLRSRYKPSTAKGLRRRLRKSVPGVSVMDVDEKDMGAAKEACEAKGIKFHRVGATRVKLVGQDEAIDEVAKSFATRVKHLPGAENKALKWKTVQFTSGPGLQTRVYGNGDRVGNSVQISQGGSGSTPWRLIVSSYRGGEVIGEYGSKEEAMAAAEQRYGRHYAN